jgi:hypothetical protein
MVVQQEGSEIEYIQHEEFYRVICSTLVKQQRNVSVLSRLRSPSQNILPTIHIFKVKVKLSLLGAMEAHRVCLAVMVS